MSALAFAIVLALLVAAPLDAQTSATLQGRVFDASGAVIPRASVTVRSVAAGFNRHVQPDVEGRYLLTGIPAGVYAIAVEAVGFRSIVIEELRIEVGRTVVRDFRLELGSRNETVVVRAEIPTVERATSSVGSVVTAQTVQEIPLNGRRFTDLGLLVPTERDNQFVVFDAASASLLRVGVDVDEIHRQNNRNFEPRTGVVWDATRDGRTVVRAAYAWAADEPGTTAVRDTASNPPFAIPLSAAGPIALASAQATTRPTGLAPATVDPSFKNASLRSWNVNVQRQLAPDVAATIGYFGSSGRNLRISRNINQPVGGVRPFAAVSESSPIVPGTPLGNITQVESTGFSNYQALWVSALMRRSRGLQFDTSYTWSKSLDTNSLNSSGFAVQDSYDIRNQYGLSDFDARHRFVLSTIYELPLGEHPLTRGWQIAAIVQSQSGNPVNLVTSNSTLTGTANSVRPDVTGPIHIVGSVDQWFDQSVFVAVDRFGNLGRNVVIGPAFHNTDLSLIKNVSVGGKAQLQFRADIFDLFNHANFGPPGNLVGSPTFGKITRTRLPTGEAGSSRQIQLAVKALF